MDGCRIVGLETTLQAGRSNFQSLKGEEISLISKISSPLLGPNQLRVKRPGSEVNHSLPSSAEVKIEWSYKSITICLHGVDKDNSTSFLLH